jgi:AraC family transcriptional regulator
MLEEAGQADRETVFVDDASAAPSPDFGFGKRLDIGSIALACGTFRPNPGAPIRFSKVTVALHASGPLRLDWRPPESDRMRSPLIADGQALMVGAGLPVWKRWGTPRTIFALALEEGFFGKIAEQTFDGRCDCAIETAVGIDDPVIRRLATLARRELDEGGAGGRLYIEGLGSYLAVHLLRRYGTVRRGAPRLSKGGLSPMQLRRVVAYIDAHLGDELGLLALSSVAGLSPHHFGEAFKASTGMPPHRYVTERRVEQARELLRDEEHALGEIAYAVGFSSQAHFTTQFRRLTGVTPGRFRRSLA